MAARVFVPSFCDGALVVFERHKDANPSGRFQAVLLLDAKGERVIEHLSHPLSASEIAQSLFIAKRFLLYCEAMSKGPLLDPLSQSTAPFGLGDPNTLMLIRNSAELKTDVYLYAAAADAYLASPLRERFSPELSLNLFRQAVALYDRSRAERFLNEEWPVIQSKSLSRHYCECFGDVFFHLARMTKQDRLAFEALKLASRANPSVERAAPLRNLAALLKESDEVIRQASIEATHRPLAPRALAQVCVAHARLGQFEDAHTTLSLLRSRDDPKPKVDVDKVEKFLAEQARVQRN